MDIAIHVSIFSRANGRVEVNHRVSMIAFRLNAICSSVAMRHGKLPRIAILHVPKALGIQLIPDSIDWDRYSNRMQPEPFSSHRTWISLPMEPETCELCLNCHRSRWSESWIALPRVGRRASGENQSHEGSRYVNRIPHNAIPTFSRSVRNRRAAENGSSKVKLFTFFKIRVWS